MAIAAPKNIGRYQILKHLESGGMGNVFLARDPAIDRRVVIKLLREEFDSAELRERFMREARSAGRLQHINIVTIFDVGEHHRRPFIAMEYLEGETLYQLIRGKAALSLNRKLLLIDELCAGLQYAHLAGIVHRDVKPSNVMLGGDGVLKVLDFGIARISDSGATGVTKAGTLMGTLNYMAPEQMMGLPDVDARADMFSAGAVFYELLTYKQAFPGGIDSGVVHKIIESRREPLAALDPSLDPELIAIVNRCLEKSREDRYPDMAAVRRDLAVVRRRYEDGTAALSRPVRRDLDRLRASQIQSYLAAARQALTGGDFAAALESSQRALLLNGDDPQALAFEHQARTALEERQINEWLTGAREELHRGALTSASLLVDRALSLNSSSPEAVAVRAEIDEARRRLAEAQERARALETALARARADLSAGAFTSVYASLNEARTIDPDNAEAEAIRVAIVAAAEARQRAQDDARARAAVTLARERFASGDHAGAIATLEGFEPSALVAGVLDELRLELWDIERLRLDAERQAEARRKAVEAAERVRKVTAQKLDDAAARFADRDLDAARVLTRAVLAEQPEHTGARALDAEIAEAIEQRRQVTAGVATARAQIDAGRFEEARRTIATIEQIDAAAPDLSGLRRAAETGLRAAEAATRRRREIEERLAGAKVALFESRDLTRALDHVSWVLRTDPTNADARALEIAVQAAIQKRRAEEQRLRDEEQRRRDDEQQRADEQRRRAEEQRQLQEETARRASEERATSALDLASQIETQGGEATRPASASSLDATIVLPTTAWPTEPPVAPPPDALPPSPIPAPAAADPNAQVHAAPTVEAMSSRRRLLYAGAAAAVLLAAAVVAWTLMPSAAPPAPSVPVVGTVVLDIAPWATIDSIRSIADGKPAQSDCHETPCLLSLPAGGYHVRASNPNFPGTLEFDVKIEPGGVREDHRTIPGFRPEEEVSKILDAKN